MDAKRVTSSCGSGTNSQRHVGVIQEEGNECVWSTVQLVSR